MRRIVFTCLGALFLWAACTHDPVEPETPEPPADPPGPVLPEGCSSDTPYFEQQILPILRGNCATSGCHNGSAAGGVRLNSYESILQTGGVQPGDPQNSNLYLVLIDPDPMERMPPAGPLPAELIQAIETWIAQGALNNSCEPDSCDLSNTTFSAKIDPLLTTYCKSCHSGANPSGGIPMETYADIKVLADNGSLVGTIDHQPGFSAMPKGANKLPQCEIDQIKQWVSDGAQNN